MELIFQYGEMYEFSIFERNLSCAYAFGSLMVNLAHFSSFFKFRK